MELIKIILLAFVLGFGVSSVRAEESKSSCVVRAEDPVIQQFFRARGFEVDSEKGDIRVEFEVTCEAVEKKKEKFSVSEHHLTTTKLEVFNQYENNQRVVYHASTIEQKTGRVESSFVVPCADTRASKAKLLEEALAVVNDINCDDE